MNSIIAIPCITPCREKNSRKGSIKKEFFLFDSIVFNSGSLTISVIAIPTRINEEVTMNTIVHDINVDNIRAKLPGIKLLIL
tara:strand:+ start:68 stop:313 length:246 start_codon:yes stop_codon:yes gene_type:complete